MAAFVFSNLVGLLRSMVTAHAFGTSLELEAFTPANRVSETLFTLVAGGALASAFIPTYTGLLAKNDRAGASRLASAIANWVMIVGSVVALLAAVFAPLVVRYLLVPSFVDNPVKFDLTVNLMRLMLPTVVIFGLSGLVMGILNSHQKFLVPALTPAMYSIGIIFGIWVLSPTLGIYGMAWGVLIGALLHLGLQVPSLLRLGGKYSLTLGIELEPVREVVRLLGPRLLGVAVVQLNFWINILLASGMPEGSINGLQYAFTVMLMPQAAIAQSIATAAMPTFSIQVARGKLDDMRSSLAAALRGVLLLAIPASVGLILLRRPVVDLLLRRGEFGAQSSELVSWALLWYAAGLVSHSVVEILARAFYAAHDTKTPVTIGVAAMILNIAFSLLFAGIFRAVGWMPHGGLALANTLATTLEMIGLGILMRKRLKGLEGRSFTRSAMAALISSGAMALALWGWLTFTAGRANWLAAGGGIALGGLIYGLLAYILGAPELRGLAGALRRKLFPTNIV